MKVLHGTWIPNIVSDFVQPGSFYLWVETPIHKKIRAYKQHPGHLAHDELATFVVQELGIKEPATKITERISPKYFALPTANDKPLPSPELVKYLEIEIPEDYDGFQYWKIDCYEVVGIPKANSPQTPKPINVIKLLNDIHFLALHNSSELQIGSDLLFWYHYTQAFKQVILKDQYIPALKYRQLETTTTKKKGKQQTSQAFEIYATWKIMSPAYESSIKKYINHIPLICLSGSSSPSDEVQFFDKETLLRHFSESLLYNLVTHTPSTAAFDKQIADSLIYQCLYPQRHNPLTTKAALEEYKQWIAWKTKITRTQSDSPFNLCLQLHSATPDNVDNWQMQFLVASKQDPSLKVALADYWTMSQKTKAGVHTQFGKEFETNLLLNLGYAARMYPKLWQGLETDRPTGLRLTLEEAFDFLKESAWVLEDAGFKVIVPAWYTPTGRRRAKIRLKASAPKQTATKTEAKSYFSLDSLVEYQYDLAIGDETVTPQEWEQLINAKAPLVHFRGQWIELDRDKMQQLLEFWQSHGDEQPQMSLLELLQRSAEIGEEWEIEHDQTLSEMMAKLQDKSQLEPVSDLPLQGTLREYQKRGVSWLDYLERLGLNGCLADDMGLGKSVQVIARLVQERQEGVSVLPTLLIAPTSVVGNWQKEIAKFAPQLKTMVHHGSDRLQDQAFKAASLQHDVVITSFTLARKDDKLLNSVEWQRIVLDEAQNIKNPKAAQTRAILKLSAKHRLALTGTPVENRLLDLWSIFNFLNPGYLGKEAQFRKSFEIPIQKENDKVKSTTLKKLVEPFILRRVKTDKSIISDLPDKVEQKLYTNLTKEQASLYEVVVKDVEEKLEKAEGIERKGLILSTLMKLKQICNHPAQFLQDGSEFSTERSHKLGRLAEMVEEAISEEESLLIFSQFTEICEGIEKYIKHTLHSNTYYLHGGTSRKRRETMITEFQDPNTEPSVFILSLKAGGVGITLTKANHVFHFDRWWNPAVENQATDRAFRIGQKKNVFVHKFVAIGTLEERIDQMIEDKKKLSSAIVGSDESWLTELDNEAFKQLIALNKSAILE
ncbi:DEAD/DEAH box helicase [Aetokthonos hydrillicola Thurmond2011]|uniref:DEAD/DEAH box helicase n=1 Tax=Aetokthonos hydrillicola Thurmond2011 TaxID=2712845 RepID=A0AAP5I6A4_9CYAN|nr:DEAD/DEAH box helicase [Aetokthonos hydrillicola]MBO3458260.1 DEAD/DEAH box helicase [Aetokthonos hydrillicola CCALA 1050]MBW4586721.1 DEAD/DEAH box helicase [Aetokthonos hydrillicola CCALA 1050]MDR9893953.1 DEAD/DEAH box helicase [Aetokthonos hydrillicola Thurmond2011]